MTRARLLPWILCALAGLGLAACGAAPAAAQEVLPTISVDEVTPGLTGYGLSVFRGATPERFGVEVLGVIRNLQPGMSFILARLSGQGLEESGVIAGMSGSPVYLDGRLAGAVSFGWPFSRGAIAGITPIATMRELTLGGAEGSGGRPVAAASPAPSWRDLLPAVAGTAPSAADLGARFARLLPALPGGATSALAWSAAGFGVLGRGLLESALGAVAPAGAAAPGTPADLEPGGSVAMVLIDGDLKLAATGTVTDRIGDQVLAFGHPVLGLGPVALPMAAAEVITVLSSQYSSFKIASPGQVLGAFQVDRTPGSRGRLGLVAPTVPMELRIRGVASRDFHLELADIPQFTPILLAMGMVGCLDAATQVAGNQGLDLTVRYHLQGHPDLTLRQSFDGAQGAMSAAGFLSTLTGFLLQNDFEEVRLSGVEIDLEQFPEPRTARLVGAHASQTLVRPGDELSLNLDLVAWRGEPFRRTLELALPRALPAGRYSLLVGDGASLDAARLQIEHANPVTLHQALELLGSFHSRRELVVLGVFAEPGLAVAGEAMPRLPASLRSIWSAAASGSATPLRLAVAQEQAEMLDVPVEGAVRIDLQVQRREPVSALGSEGGEGGPATPSQDDRTGPSGSGPAPRAAGEPAPGADAPQGGGSDEGQSNA